MGVEELSLHRNPSFFPRSQKEESRGAIIGVIGSRVHIYVYIGPGAQSEDMNSPRMGKHLPRNPCW